MNRNTTRPARWFDMVVDPDKISRSTTRTEWRTIDQWRRIVRRMAHAIFIAHPTPPSQIKIMDQK